MSYRPAGAYQPIFWSISSVDSRYCGRIGGGGPGTSTAWVAGLAVYVPFVISMPCTVYEWWHQNGTLTTAHNLDFGVYNLDFTKVGSIGSSAGGTTASAINNTSGETDIVLAAGQYYMAFCDDSTRNIACATEPIGIHQAAGLLEQTGLSSTLPSPAVPVTFTRAFVPIFGMNLYTVAL